MPMKKLLLIFIAAVLILATVIWCIGTADRISAGQAEQGRQQLETALRRAAVACYAAEGIYPPTLEYLQTHYGVQIDTQRYTVFYEIFAENLMPEITVLVK